MSAPSSLSAQQQGERTSGCVYYVAPPQEKTGDDTAMGDGLLAPDVEGRTLLDRLDLETELLLELNDEVDDWADGEFEVVIGNMMGRHRVFYTKNDRFTDHNLVESTHGEQSVDDSLPVERQDGSAAPVQEAALFRNTSRPRATYAGAYPLPLPLRGGKLLPGRQEQYITPVSDTMALPQYDTGYVASTGTDSGRDAYVDFAALNHPWFWGACWPRAYGDNWQGDYVPLSDAVDEEQKAPLLHTTELDQTGLTSADGSVELDTTVAFAGGDGAEDEAEDASQELTRISLASAAKADADQPRTSFGLAPTAAVAVIPVLSGATVSSDSHISSTTQLPSSAAVQYIDNALTVTPSNTPGWTSDTPLFNSNVYWVRRNTSNGSFGFIIDGEDQARWVMQQGLATANSNRYYTFISHISGNSATGFQIINLHDRVGDADTPFGITSISQVNKTHTLYITNNGYIYFQNNTREIAASTTNAATSGLIRVGGAVTFNANTCVYLRNNKFISSEGNRHREVFGGLVNTGSTLYFASTVGYIMITGNKVELGASNGCNNHVRGGVAYTEENGVSFRANKNIIAIQQNTVTKTGGSDSMEIMGGVFYTRYFKMYDNLAAAAIYIEANGINVTDSHSTGLIQIC